MTDKKVAVLIPCYNEELTIAKVVDDFTEVLPDAKVYVYDNNSTDRSAEIAREHGAIVVPSPIQGKGAVVKQMFREIDADEYLMVDADNTYPAIYARALIEGLENFNCDMVIGDRLSSNYYADNKRKFHGFGNALVKFLINHLYHGTVVELITGATMPLTDVMTGYRVFTHEFVKNIGLESDGFEIETEMTIKALRKGYRIGTLPVQYLDRPAGSYSKLETYSDGRKVLRMIMRMWRQ